MTIAYEYLADSLAQLKLDQDAAEYHGILCGMLCYRDDAPVDLGLARDGQDVSQAAGDCLRELRKESLQQLQQAHIEFHLLLPEDEESLAERVEALAQWCGGFLHGLAANPQLDLRQLSQDAQELVRDFTELSRAGLETGEADEQGENDFAELVEYVRVGAQLLFLELRQAQSRGQDAAGRVH